MGKYNTGEAINAAYEQARESYAEYGVDTDAALAKLSKIPVSLHCWQGDDVKGFEVIDTSGGGIMATGNYPGIARNGNELRQDFEKAVSLIPGKKRINLHGLYAETDGEVVDRKDIKIEHFRKWINWAKEKGYGVDFAPSCFGHPMAETGFTIGSKDETIRKYWVDYIKTCHRISQDIGKEIGETVYMNIWVPDGYKDIPADRFGHRMQMKKSLDEILSEPIDPKYAKTTLESKLFGLGLESYTVGSHEFVFGYSLKYGTVVCYDMGHFHISESVADKISATLPFVDEILIHVSRAVRWDSDHVVILNDELQAVMQEVKRADALERVHFALDFFDASINRISAWVTGTRATVKSLLISLLEPTHLLLKAEEDFNYGLRLALTEEIKMLPYPAVWNKFCYDNNVPINADWWDEISKYEDEVLSKRI
jgi:L-rhamnose isomerase